MLMLMLMLMLMMLIARVAVVCTSALPLKLSEFSRHAKWDKTQVQ